MNPGRVLWLAVVLAVLARPAAATDPTAPPLNPQWPTIVAIEFEGNETTQEKVMLREMALGVGDAADPKQIERSRQYIQDLGLFRWVRASAEPVAGGVRLKISVNEKWYILPYPRLSATVEGQSSVGAELRWTNVGGLNHSLRVNALRTDLKQLNRGRESSYSLGYTAPFLFDSPYRVSVSAGHTLSPVSDPAPANSPCPVAAPVNYDETFDSTSLFVSRTFPDEGGARSQGTTIGAGLIWQREDRAGECVPQPYGRAIALSTGYGYRNIRFRTYSEEGVSWRINTAVAGRGTASDYSFFSADASYNRYLNVGDVAHQSLNYSFSAGTFSRGPREVLAYSFGGSSVLRGYDANSLEGNAYYLATVEFFRPVYRSSVRVGAILEAGKVFESTHDLSLHSIDASLGIGVRVRLSRFVNLDIDLGYAVPLNGGAGKLYGGRV